MTELLTLVIATQNKGKLTELQQIVSQLHLRLADLTEFQNIQDVPETGGTFAENAELKAASYARQTRHFTLADDSGLRIDALGGEPGVYSARYLGDSVSFTLRIESLLKRLERVDAQHRTARFTCAIAIADPEGAILNTSIGTCEGMISMEPRGSGGFGYDPIFMPVGYNRTFGELDSMTKNQISHRARALHQTIAYLQSLTRSASAD